MLQPTTDKGMARSVSVSCDNRLAPLKSQPPSGRRISKVPTGIVRRDILGLGCLVETEDPEEMLDDEALFSKLQKIFETKEEEEDSGLPIDEFKEAMRKTVGRNNTEDEIELLFMKVDANCDGQVDWEEYVTYNLLEYKEKTLMMEMLRERPFPNEIREIESRHRDVIVKILFFPNVRKTGSKNCKIDTNSGKYLTLSKEGLLGIWNMKMKNPKYHNANHYTSRNTQPWFTDMIAMYNVNMVAMTTTDRDITIFDLNSKKFTMRYYVTGFDNCLTAMDYWVDPNDWNIALLLLGDTSGNVTCIRFETCLRGGPFGSVQGKKTCKKVIFPEVVKGFILGVKAQKLSNVHEDWVNKVMYLPSIDCFLSSCQGTRTGLFFGDFTGKKSHVYFKVNKGVLCFDYSNLLNIIVTGGMDYLLRVWNPYVNNKAIVLLKGHTKPINHVIINETKNQVISIDKGRSLRVYDLRDQSCLQQISGRIIKFDNFPISAVNFNPRMRTILLAANQIIMLEKRVEEESTAEVVTHNKPVVGALYSKVFNSVVSACQDSVVSVWDSNTGDKLMQFVNAHSRIERGVKIPVEITALCFDYNGRRLLTGARNGTVHVWNFNNGSLMQNFELPDNSAVTGIAASRHNFYITGWGRAVHIYIDGEGEHHRKNWRIQHKEDVLCIAALLPNIIATGSYDGDVVIWSRDTGQVYSRLNAFESVRTIGEFSSRRNALISKKDESEGTTPLTVSASSSEKDDMTSPNQWTKRKAKLTGTIGLLGRTRAKTADLSEDTCEHPLLYALDDSFDSGDAKYSRDEYDSVCKRYESAVEKIIFLESREPNHKDTAILVTSGAEGWIRFWSMHHEGGLLGQFNAAHRLGESILSLTSDTNNYFLVTGDTQGYVKLWDIKDYCTNKKMSLSDRIRHIEMLKRKFTFFRVESYHTTKQRFSVTESLKHIFAARPPPSSSEPSKTLRYPPLINSFRAHTRPIHSVDLVSDRDILITASADCSVRLWTVNGQYIGTFGGDKWVPLPRVVTNEYFLSQVWFRSIIFQMLYMYGT